MSYVKSMMAEAKCVFALILSLLHLYCCKLLHGVARVLLACIRVAALLLALPLIAPQLFQDVTEELATKEEKA